MSGQQTWIEQQKNNRLFRGGGRGSDAERMLEHGETNRQLSVGMARKVTGARYIGRIIGVSCYAELAGMVEKAQMCVDARTRQDFMKVAIEQWQGKVQALKGKLLSELV